MHFSENKNSEVHLVHYSEKEVHVTLVTFEQSNMYSRVVEFLAFDIKI